MKRIYSSLFAAIMLLALCQGAAAQHHLLEIVKGGETVFSSDTDGFDYVTVVSRLDKPLYVLGRTAEGKVVLTWNAIPGAASYKVFRSADGGDFALLGSSATNSFTDSSPVIGTCHYRVQAFGDGALESFVSDSSPAVQYTPGGGTSDVYPTHDGHEYADLGLPSGLKWAVCNIGANAPEEYGCYYAWGEAQEKSIYTTENSLTHGKILDELAASGIIGADGNLTPEYDTARQIWGGSWRMPTLDEIKELVGNCTFVYTTRNGVAGMRVTSNINGNSIFLPATGFREHRKLFCPHYMGNYWTSTPRQGYNHNAYVLNIDPDFDPYWIDGTKYLGQSVRPVAE